MNLLVIFISILYTYFQVQVSAKFYFERDTTTGFVLYECENKVNADGTKFIDCKLAQGRTKHDIYATASFYATHVPTLEPKCYIKFNDDVLAQLPSYGFVGFIPGAIDLPEFQNWRGYWRIGDADLRKQLAALSPTFIDAGNLKAAEDFLRLNSIRIIMDHEDNWRELMSSYIVTLFKIMDAEAEKPLPKLFPTPEDKVADKKWMKDLKKVTKLFLNKMMDPCAVLKSEGVDKPLADHYCRTYCEYITFAGNLFGFATYVCDKCNSLKEGKCVNQLCICKQHKKAWKFELNRQVKMLVCHNRFRLKMNK